MYFIARDLPNGERQRIFLNEAAIYGFMCEICGAFTVFDSFDREEQFLDEIRKNGIYSTSHYCYDCKVKHA